MTGFLAALALIALCVLLLFVWKRSKRTAFPKSSFRSFEGQPEVGDGVGQRRLALEAGMLAPIPDDAGAAEALKLPVEPTSPKLTIRVGPGESHQTIREALTAAATGVTIELAPGVYKEMLDPGLPISIVGPAEGAAMLLSPEGKTVVASKAAWLKISRVTIRNVSGPWYAVYATNGWITLEECVISSTGAGAGAAGDRSGAIIKRCHIHDCVGAAVYVQEGANLLLECSQLEKSGYGAAVQGGSAWIQHNRVSHCEIGVSVSASEGCRIEANAIGHGRKRGICAHHDRGSVITCNSIHHTDLGVHLQDSNEIKLVGNEILRSHNDGVLLEQGTVAQIAGNRIEQNDGFGVFSDQTSGVTLQGNAFKENALGETNLDQESSQHWDIA